MDSTFLSWSLHVHACSDAEFVIQFSGDTPAVNGDQVFVSFSSSVPVESATCSITTQPSVDCEYTYDIVHTSLKLTIVSDYS